MGIVHIVLVERVVVPYQEAYGTGSAPAATPRLLPGAGNAAGITGKDGSFQVSDIYTQLQCIGRHHAQQLSAEQVLLYFPPVFGQISGAVRFYQLSLVFIQVVSAVHVDQFGKLAGTGESKAADVLPDKLGKQAGGFAVTAAAGCFFLVNNRRIPENEGLLPVRRAIPVNQHELLAHQVLGVFQGVADGGGTADELRFGAIEFTYPA